MFVVLAQDLKLCLLSLLAFCIFSEYFFHDFLNFFLQVRPRSFQIPEGKADSGIVAHFSVLSHSAMILTFRSWLCWKLWTPVFASAHSNKELSFWFLCLVLWISKYWWLKAVQKVFFTPVSFPFMWDLGLSSSHFRYCLLKHCHSFSINFLLLFNYSCPYFPPLLSPAIPTPYLPHFIQLL